MNDFLTQETQITALLHAFLKKDTDELRKPLTSTEYNSLTRWLAKMNLELTDLFQAENIHRASQAIGIPQERLEFLLKREEELNVALEEWHEQGIWLISQSDADYPIRFKQHLKRRLPPLLFGVGNRSLLKGGGLAIVGSRKIDDDNKRFTRQVAQICAQNQITVVSGGARGVDQIAMTAVLKANGVGIAILADNLLKKSQQKQYDRPLAEGRLLLLSPYKPTISFRVWKAMERNKLIYAMADYGLVVRSEEEKGGTWAGAKEELKRNPHRPIFVNVTNISSGNQKLLKMGALEWPQNIQKDKLKQQIEEIVAQNKKTNIQPTQLTFF